MSKKDPFAALGLKPPSGGGKELATPELTEEQVADKMEKLLQLAAKLCDDDIFDMQLILFAASDELRVQIKESFEEC